MCWANLANIIFDDWCLHMVYCVIKSFFQAKSKILLFLKTRKHKTTLNLKQAIPGFNILWFGELGFKSWLPMDFPNHFYTSQIPCFELRRTRCFHLPSAFPNAFVHWDYYFLCFSQQHSDIYSFMQQYFNLLKCVRCYFYV